MTILFCEIVFQHFLTRLNSIWAPPPPFNNEIGLMASNMLYIFSFNIWAICSCRLHLPPELHVTDPVFLSVRPRLAPGSSRPAAVSVHSNSSAAGCYWLLSVWLAFWHLSSWVPRQAWVLWGPRVLSALVCCRPYCLLTSLSLVTLMLHLKSLHYICFALEARPFRPWACLPLCFTHTRSHLVFQTRWCLPPKAFLFLFLNLSLF